MTPLLQLDGLVKHFPFRDSLGRKRGGGKPDAIGSATARRKSFLQVSMEQNMGCAVGACLGCVVMGVSGTPQRVCREGPVFASDELVWEGAWTG